MQDDKTGPFAKAVSGDGESTALTTVKNDVTFEVETITPEMAERYLGTVDTERAKTRDKKAIDTYAAAMKADAWVMNGMPIIFDTDGRLIDGVQRLAAAVAANKSFRTFVARNVRADTLHTIDQHRRRAYHGTLEGRGIRNASAIVALMGRLIRMENGTFGLADLRINWTRFDQVLEANPELHEAIDVSNTFSGNVIPSAARNMVVFMAIRSGHLAQMRHFLAEVEDETATVMNAATVLSTQLEAQRASFGYDVDHAAAVTILAFNDYLEGTHKRAYIWKPGRADITGDIEGKDLEPDMLTGIPRIRRYNRARINRYHDWNLNFPRMTDYPGVREGKAQDDEIHQKFVGKMAQDLQDATAGASGQEFAEIVEITPDIARDLLDRFNKENRNIQETHVRMIARDIDKSDWMFNAQPICFTANPFLPDAQYPDVRLLNGQHRLEACVRADAPILVPIAVNIDRRAFTTYDTHAKKSVTVGGNLGAIERILKSACIIQWRIDNGMRFNDRARPSATELIDTVKRHESMPDHVSLARRMKTFGSAGILTFFIYNILNERPQLADDFLHQLETGEEIERGNPVRELRDTLLALRPQDAPGDKSPPGMSTATRKRKSASRMKVLGTLMDGWEQFKEYKLGKVKGDAQASP